MEREKLTNSNAGEGNPKDWRLNQVTSSAEVSGRTDRGSEYLRWEWRKKRLSRQSHYALTKIWHCLVPLGNHECLVRLETGGRCIMKCLVQWVWNFLVDGFQERSREFSATHSPRLTWASWGVFCPGSDLWLHHWIGSSSGWLGFCLKDNCGLPDTAYP